MSKPKHMGGLGFRNIELFNVTLPARQAWRLLQDPSSLSAWILKAAYFPTSDLLDAVGFSPSKVWRSVVDGIQVLRQA
jgi:hypothetical protein